MAATIAPAPKRHQRNLVSTLAATARKADLAPRHYRNPAPGDMPRKTTSAASRRRSGSDGALRLGPPARRTPPTARIIVSSARITFGSSRPEFAARCMRPPSSTISRRTSVALPGTSARTATMRPWAAGSPGSTDARSRPPQRAAPARRRRRARRTSPGRTPRPAVAGPLVRYQRAGPLSHTPWPASGSTTEPTAQKRINSRATAACTGSPSTTIPE